MAFQPRREPSTIYGTDNIYEKESARFVSSNLSVPRSLLTTTLRTDMCCPLSVELAVLSEDTAAYGLAVIVSVNLAA
jgi:hypothetical protein